ncbi:MAG: TIGR02710 family CRISPR-associated CARF protein, partial [Nitrospira sp.]|nr:TIGR02710 family CRISPR-associated CARF protein [Nitrospira sp.]
MPQQETIKALLISLGDDPQRAILTINHYRPEYLLFFATEQAKSLIELVIQPGIQQMPKRWDCVVTSNATSFTDCYQALAKQLSPLLHNWQIQPGELVVDYTAGSQSMVMALALAATDHCTRFVFAAGTVFQEANPWDQRAADEARKAAISFNQGRYAQARTSFSRLQERVSGSLKPLYKALSDLADGYDLWDGFQYQKALEKLKGAKRTLELSAVWGGPAGLKTVLTTVGENLGFLEKIMMAQRKPDRTHFLDLIANAKRQAEIHHHYEDAMVRVYRALEVLTQVQLDKAFGMKSQDVRPEQLPESVREEYRRSFTSELDGRIKLPVYAAYNLLKLLGDPLGQNFFNLWPQIKLILDVRH